MHIEVRKINWSIPVLKKVRFRNKNDVMIVEGAKGSEDGKDGAKDGSKVYIRGEEFLVRKGRALTTEVHRGEGERLRGYAKRVV